MKKTLAALLIAMLGNVAVASPDVRDGDIIFHTSRSSQSVAVQRATGSRYSHMGVIFHRDGKPHVLEAAATVRYTPLESWIARGDGQHYVVKRLGNNAAALTPEAVGKLARTSLMFLDRPYDLTFEWSDDRMYCSELVWKLYDRALGVRIGALQRLRDFNISDQVVRAKMRERYGDHPPLAEPVISPAAMFDSPLLVTVAQE